MNEMTIYGKKLNDHIYSYVPGLWVITAYYNPLGYRSRRTNYEAFAHVMRRSGIPLLTVECAFGDQPYDLPESVDVVRVRSASLLWQKERLLNLAISWLPRSCEFVAWLDCDLVFTNQDWTKETAALLRDVSVVQVFDTCNRLPREYVMAVVGGEICTSFARVVENDPTSLRTGKYQDHGHTGYGWAARRDILDLHGLYEHAVAGSADHYMAHAAIGDLDSPCIQRLMMRNKTLINHFREWAEPFHASVRGGLKAVSGEVLHLWHGELADRNYMLRHVEFSEFGFDPYADLVAVPGRPFEFKSTQGKEKLVEWFRMYFTARHEDGVRRAA